MVRTLARIGSSYKDRQKGYSSRNDQELEQTDHDDWPGTEGD